MTETKLNRNKLAKKIVEFRGECRAVLADEKLRPFTIGWMYGFCNGLGLDNKHGKRFATWANAVRHGRQGGEDE